jgi:hypothetical protein
MVGDKVLTAGAKMIRHSAIAAALSASLIVSAGSGVLAGDCTDTTRKVSVTNSLFSDGAADTTVRNQASDLSADVTISRRDAEKQSATLNNGNSTGFLAKGTESAEITVTIKDPDTTGTAKCGYEVSTKSSKTTWSRTQNANCSDVKSFCSSCKITCSKSYNPDKNRWNTTYTIKDSGS